MITDVLFYYNNKYKHSTTKIILREILFNSSIKEIIEELIINIEKSRENFIQKFDNDVINSLLINSWFLSYQIKEFDRLNEKKHWKKLMEKEKDSQYQMNNNQKGL